MKRRFLWIVVAGLGLGGSLASAQSIIGNTVQSGQTKDFSNLINSDKQRQADVERQAARFVRRDPYVPQKIDYGLEIGSMSLKNNLYLLGGNLGYHAGECVFVHTHTCQNYIDFLLESNGRDGYTYTTGSVSLRWQYISFPSSWSPMARIYLGGRNDMTPEGVAQVATAGLGFGIATYLHPRADLRIEGRVGFADQIYGQMMISIQFKADRWVDYFANRLRDVGLGTASVTGTVLKTTVDVTGNVVTGTAGAVGSAVGGAAGAVGSVVGGAAGAVGGAAGAVGSAIKDTIYSPKEESKK